LAVIERLNRKQLQLEVASNSRANLQLLTRNFDGRIKKLPRNWLRRALRRKTKPFRVGNKKLKIPAGAAFGTGEHATTAMSLRMLEKLARDWKRGWLLLDLGTGSGILALAARLLGAKRVVVIDNDPVAISTARENARLNEISDVTFHIADVRNWKFPRDVDVITANLFSELLVKIAPKFKAARWLILSGILRVQEDDVRQALTRQNIDIIEVRRRGKWVAILARRK
jgi:ribosomal protein L11 methyltransferase